MAIVGIDHVQLAMPAGREDEARGFYSGLLEIPERPKPAELAKRGGVWFENDAVKVHLGVEAEFRPARKAHPALLVRELGAMVARLRRAGIEVLEDQTPGYYRVYVSDPFGNRLELMEPLPTGVTTGRLLGAWAAVLLSASIALADWVIVAPPLVRKRHCEVAYDRSAPIAKWPKLWTPFPTLDACEAMRIELVKRVTAPGREERLRAAAEEREASNREAERRLREDAKHDPDAKKMLAILPRRRSGDPASCGGYVEDDWRDSRCVERVNP